MLVPIFYFDQDGYFSRAGRAQKMQDGSVLMPDDATQTMPEAEKLATHFAKWNSGLGEWTYEAMPVSAADFEGLKISHKSQTEHDREMRKLIQELTKGSTEYKIIRGSKEEGLWWGVERIPEKTQDEKDLEAAKQEEQELQSFLNSTDYVAAKLAEGVATKEEYADVLLQRADARDRINVLRASQESLTAKIAEAKA